MSFDIEIIKELPKDQIKQFEDYVIYEIARTILDLTEGHFPRLSGDLELGSYKVGVVGSNSKYGIGTDVDYAKYVWNYSQDANWTNKNTYAQWYLTTFKNKGEAIVNQAVEGALKRL